jgi:hypothetical protein
MKKFLEFILVLINPAIEFLAGTIVVCLLVIWVFTGFGIFIIFCPSLFPTPEWIRLSVLVFDILLLILFLCSQIQQAYNKIYKN